MRQNRPGLTAYTLNMITVLAAVISATTTVFIASRHGELVARLNQLQSQSGSTTDAENKEVRFTPTPDQDASQMQFKLYIGAYQPADLKGAMIQFWVPEKGFKVTSEAYSAEEKAACEKNYAQSIQQLENGILQFATGWNVCKTNGCWTKEGCHSVDCAICEPGKIYTVILSDARQMDAMSTYLAGADGKGIVQKLFCQDAVLMVNASVGGGGS